MHAYVSLCARVRACFRGASGGKNEEGTADDGRLRSGFPFFPFPFIRLHVEIMVSVRDEDACVCVCVCIRRTSMVVEGTPDKHTHTRLSICIYTKRDQNSHVSFRSLSSLFFSSRNSCFCVCACVPLLLRILVFSLFFPRRPLFSLCFPLLKKRARTHACTHVSAHTQGLRNRCRGINAANRPTRARIRRGAGGQHTEEGVSHSLSNSTCQAPPLSDYYYPLD